jgi:hypothetical protein
VERALSGDYPADLYSGEIASLGALDERELAELSTLKAAKLLQQGAHEGKDAPDAQQQSPDTGNNSSQGCFLNIGDCVETGVTCGNGHFICSTCLNGWVGARNQDRFEVDEIFR